MKENNLILAVLECNLNKMTYNRFDVRDPDYKVQAFDFLEFATKEIQKMCDEKGVQEPHVHIYLKYYSNKIADSVEASFLIESSKFPLNT